MEANESSKTYPVQFRDKIDEYLWKEHHILGGGCSSIENLKYSEKIGYPERFKAQKGERV